MRQENMDDWWRWKDLGVLEIVSNFLDDVVYGTSNCARKNSVWLAHICMKHLLGCSFPEAAHLTQGGKIWFTKMSKNNFDFTYRQSKSTNRIVCKWRNKSMEAIWWCQQGNWQVDTY